MAICNPLHRLALALAAAAILLPGAAARAEEPVKDFSAAERALFMTDQFVKLRPPVTLRYRFHRSGSLEPAFDDKVSIALKAQQGTGRCCDATGEFLSGERKIELPAVEGAAGNPVTLFFLERDVREMQRLTTGKSAYFRKRIRMAIYQGAQQRAVTLRYRGKAIAGQEFTVTPYSDDPNRPRFEQFAIDMPHLDEATVPTRDAPGAVDDEDPVGGRFERRRQHRVGFAELVDGGHPVGDVVTGRHQAHHGGIVEQVGERQRERNGSTRRMPEPHVDRDRRGE